MPTAKYPKPLRRYPNTVPVAGESYLEAKFRQECLVTLARKVANAKPRVDCGPPRTVSTVKLKLKKLMEESLILADLEFKNRHLLKRIIETMNAPATTDNHLNITNRPTSLNFGLRMLEANRINEENLRTLGRILQAKTKYDRVKQEEDYQSLSKGRKNKREVFRLWNELSEERKQDILQERAAATSKYGRMDPDEMRARYRQMHQDCQPEYFFFDVYYSIPVPPSCRSAPDAKKVDHSRCLRDDRQILPPIARGRHRSTSPSQSPKTTRTVTLRKEEVKKRAYDWEMNLQHSAGTFHENRPGEGEKLKSRGDVDSNKSASANPSPEPRSAACATFDHFASEPSSKARAPVCRRRKSLPSAPKKALSAAPFKAKSRRKSVKKQHTDRGEVVEKASTKGRLSDGAGEGKVPASMASPGSDSEPKVSISAAEDVTRGTASTNPQATDSENEEPEKHTSGEGTEDACQGSKSEAVTASVCDYPSSVTTEETPQPPATTDEGDGKENQAEEEGHQECSGRQTGDSATATVEGTETVPSDETSQGGDEPAPSSWVYTSVESPSLSPCSPDERALTAASFSPPPRTDPTDSEVEEASEQQQRQE